jgi:hypothetical protein
MKSKLLNKGIQWEDVDFVLLFLAIISLYFHYRINGFLVMLLMIYSGIKFVFGKLQFRGYGQLFFLPAIFLMLILGQLWTVDLKEGWTIIERNLSLLLLPIAVYGIVTISEKRSQLLIKGFIWTAFIIAITCLVIAFSWSIAHKTMYVISIRTSRCLFGLICCILLTCFTLSIPKSEIESYTKNYQSRINFIFLWIPLFAQIGEYSRWICFLCVLTSLCAF